MDHGHSKIRDSIMRVFPDAQLIPLTDQELNEIRLRFPGVPDHYLSFLGSIGYGSLGRNFMLYSGPCEPSDFFDDATAVNLKGIVFFGDNFSGWMVGFDTRDDWRIVGVDCSSLDPFPESHQTVADFFAQRVAAMESS